MTQNVGTKKVFYPKTRKETLLCKPTKFQCQKNYSLPKVLVKWNLIITKIDATHERKSKGYSPLFWAQQEDP